MLLPVILIVLLILGMAGSELMYRLWLRLRPHLAKVSGNTKQWSRRLPTWSNREPLLPADDTERDNLDAEDDRRGNIGVNTTLTDSQFDPDVQATMDES